MLSVALAPDQWRSNAILYLPISGPTTASELEFAIPQSTSTSCSSLHAQLNPQHPFPYFVVDGTIAANTTCSISVETQALVAGTHVNEISPQRVATDIAANSNESDARLTVACALGFALAPIDAWPLLLAIALGVLGLAPQILTRDSMDLDDDA